MELSFKVILIPHKREKDLVFNTKSRFFQNNWIPTEVATYVAAKSLPE